MKMIGSYLTFEINFKQKLFGFSLKLISFYLKSTSIVKII